MAFEDIQLMTNPHVDRACNAIDAAMYSGDAFLREENRKALRAWMARWERGLEEMAEIDAACEDEEEE